MDKSTWLTIALIISTFIANCVGPIIGALMSRRNSQPKLTPDANQPKDRITVKDGLLRQRRKHDRFAALGSLAGVAICLGILIRELSAPEPLTRGSILVISCAAASLVITPANHFVLRIILENDRHHTDMISQIIATTNTVIESQSVLADTQKLLNDKIEKPPIRHSVGERMKSAIAKLLTW
jgi:hypothetical protein